jgi:hypothetical protein
MFLTKNVGTTQYMPTKKEAAELYGGFYGCLRPMKWMERLLKLRRDIRKLGVEGRADRIHGGDNYDRNASSN